MTYAGDLRPPSLSLWVAGVPKPQGSLRNFKVGKAHITVHANHDDLMIWRNAITREASQMWGDHPLLDEPASIVLYFYLPRPVSAPKKRKFPERKPDLDKLIRAVLDSLTGIVLADDARIVSIGAHKLYAVEHPTGCRIELWPMTEVNP